MELKQEQSLTITTQEVELERVYRTPRSFPLTDEENSIHLDFLTKNLKDAVWLKEG